MPIGGGQSEREKEWAKILVEQSKLNKETGESLKYVWAQIKKQYKYGKDMSKALDDLNQYSLAKRIVSRLTGNRADEEKMLDELKKYEELRQKVLSEITDEKKQKAELQKLDNSIAKKLEDYQNENSDYGFIGDVTDKITEKVGDGLTNAIMNPSNFGKELKKAGASLGSEIVKTCVNQVVSSVINKDNSKLAAEFLKDSLQWGGKSILTQLKGLKNILFPAKSENEDGSATGFASFISSLTKQQEESAGLFSKIKEFFSFGEGGFVSKIGSVFKDLFSGAGGLLTNAISFIKDLFSGMGGGFGIMNNGADSIFSTTGEKNSGGGLDSLSAALKNLLSEDGPLGGIITMVKNLLNTIAGPDGILTRIIGLIPGIGSFLTGGVIKGIAGGGKSGFISGLTGMFSSMFKFHSGGLVPESGSFEVPGQKEQLALLKGGERVLSPGENVQYKQESQKPILVNNNFVIKSWDSRDVAKCFVENKDILNAITADGIKYNNGHLRTMVRNA